MEEFQEADVLWPWQHTPPRSPSPGWESYLPVAPELMYEYDAAAVGSPCEPFSDSEPASSSTSSPSLTLSALPSDWSSDGFSFLSGPSTVSSGLGIDATEELLEADVLWPDTADEEEEDTAEFWCRRCSRRVEEIAAAVPVAAACGKREGRRPLVSSPIDIPMATRAAARRRPLPSAVVAYRRW